MPRVTRILRRPTPLGLAIAVYDVWRRLPPQHRKAIADATRRHGPRLAARLAKRARARRSS